MSLWTFRLRILMKLRIAFCALVIASVFGCGSDHEVPPAEIAEWFTVPEGLTGEGYRSPLVFENGDTVRTAEAWAARREEIRQKWTDELGEWPDILKDGNLTFNDTVQCDGYVRYGVVFEWLPDRMTEGYLLVPEVVKGEIPAVITVYYEPETAVGLSELPCRDFAVQIARKGMAALSIGTSETTRDKVYSLYYPSLDSSAIQPLSVLAYAAANALEALAKVPFIDGDRIGIMGHSYGGKWAMMASCLYDRFACAVWGDPGIVLDESKGTYVNYWAPWYLGYFNPPWDAVPDLWAQDGYKYARGAYKSLKDKGMDLHELHSLMAPRPFMVSGGYADGAERWEALWHTVEVNRLLGHKHRVGLSLRPSHEPDSASNEAVCTFLKWCLDSGNSFAERL